jgi:predicted transcriptional regulator
MNQMDQCSIPTAEAFVAAVQSLDLPGLRTLSRKSEVPYATLWNIHRGASKNPQLETVRKLWPHLGSKLQREA